MSQKQQNIVLSHDANLAPGDESGEPFGSFGYAQGSSSKMVTPKSLKEFPLTTGAGTFVPASNAFGFQLLSSLSKGNADASKNIFLSPLSLSLALALVMDGADGKTRQQMQKALGYKPSDSPSAIDADVKAFLASYKGKKLSPDVAATIASALWPNSALPPSQGRLAPAYAARAKQVFGAPVQAVDFSNASGARQVNAWTKEKTSGRIPTILPEVPMPSAVLVLTNAVRFKARWNRHFERSATHDGPFTLGSGQKITLPMMRYTGFGTILYQKGSGFKAVQMPYDDGRFSMHVVLPDEGLSLGAVMQKQFASAAQWNRYLARFKSVKVELEMPRFKIEADAGELAPYLSALGMTAAFDPRAADFRPMGYSAAVLSAVRHKTTLIVDEEGSEATAVTAIPMAGVTPTPPEPFVVNRPFACAIRDNATGALLFVGLIATPETV